jgi:hypothetical protein
VGVTFVAAKGRGQEPATASDDLENRPTICEADLSHAHILLLHLFGWFEQGHAVAGGNVHAGRQGLAPLASILARVTSTSRLNY